MCTKKCFSKRTSQKPNRRWILVSPTEKNKLAIQSNTSNPNHSSSLWIEHNQIIIFCMNTKITNQFKNAQKTKSISLAPQSGNVMQWWPLNAWHLESDQDIFSLHTCYRNILNSCITIIIFLLITWLRIRSKSMSRSFGHWLEKPYLSKMEPIANH